MKLHQVPARNGATWVRRGFAVFFKRPLVFAVLFAGVMFFGLVALLLPFVGEFVMLAAMPLVSLGFMPVSMALAGPVGHTLGLRTTFLVAGTVPVALAVVAILGARMHRDEIAHPLD